MSKLKHRHKQAAAVSEAPKSEFSSGQEKRIFGIRMPTWMDTFIGMVIGGIVAIAIEAGIESTGVLGPKVDALIEDQTQNFEQIKGKLDTLAETVGTPETQALVYDLQTLLARQANLTRTANTQLQKLEQQRVDVKDKDLAATGIATDIDFWLEPGESVNVASLENALGLLTLNRTTVQVNVTGDRHQLQIGDSLDVNVSNQSCRVILRQIKFDRQVDLRRAGFDISCAREAAARG